MRPLFSLNWGLLKTWGARLFLLVAIYKTLAPGGDGFVDFIAARAAKSFNADIQSFQSTLRTVTDVNIPFLTNSVNAWNEKQRQYELATDEKFKTINAKLDQVVTKEDLKIFLQAIQK